MASRHSLQGSQPSCIVNLAAETLYIRHLASCILPHSACAAQCWGPCRVNPQKSITSREPCVLPCPKGWGHDDGP